MRTSGQLDKISRCENNKATSLTSTSARMVRAKAQKNIIKRLLQGEPIPDVEQELDSLLTAGGYPWENFEQRTGLLSTLTGRISRYVAFEAGRNHIFPTDDMPLVVDYFGEPVTALPDFFVEEGDTVYVCKVSTSKYQDDKTDRQRDEAYALGLCGEQCFPGKNIVLQYLHLAEKSPEEERRKINTGVPYDQEQRNQSVRTICQFPFDAAMKQAFEEKHNEEEQAKTVGCSPEDCAACPMNNICNFKEAPIQIPTEAGGVSLDNIRPKQEQRDVIEFERGIARVNAGAGAGKTFVTAARIVRLLEKGYEPEDFCLLTFTRAGAEEMTSRVMRLAAMKGIPLDPDRFTSGTINSFCQSIIVRHYDVLGYKEPPKCIEPDDARRYAMLNDIINMYPKIAGWNYEASASDKFTFGANSKAAIKMISSATEVYSKFPNNEDEFKEELKRRHGRVYTDEDYSTLREMIFKYEEMKKEKCYIEYSDQLRLVFKLGELMPDLYNSLGFKHIMVDEFQDTDYDQIQLLNKMIDTRNFVSFAAVGDDSQSIFAFRDTSPEYMINFGNYFGGGHFTDFPLVENHRSGKDIIEFANAINATANSRVEKDLIATRPAEIKPTVQGYYTKLQEYRAIAKSIREKWDASENLPEEQRRKVRDIAVLASDRYEIQEIAAQLTELGIPSVLMNPVPYIENSRVAALTSFYNAFKGKGTQGFADYQNVLHHGEYKAATAEQLDAIAADFACVVQNTDMSLAAFKEFAAKLDEHGVDDCYTSFCEKLDECKKMEELDEFFEAFQLYGKNSTFKIQGKFEGVCITTVHSSKGLEWNTTYLTLSKFDKNDHHASAYRFENSKEHDEIVRKYFVGATRARDELIITGTYQIEKSGKQKTQAVYFNRYLQQAYALLGKAWDYKHSEKIKQKDLEAAEKEAKKVNYERKSTPVHEKPTYGRAYVKEGIAEMLRKRNPLMHDTPTPPVVSISPNGNTVVVTEAPAPTPTEPPTGTPASTDVKTTEDDERED